MKRLMKKADFKEIKMQDLIRIEGNTITLADDIYSFFEDNLLNTIRNISYDEKNDVIVAHFVLDRASLEDYTNHPIDDATCKIVAKTLISNEEFMQVMNEKVEDRLREIGHEVTVFNIDFEFGDGVFHLIITCTK